MHGQWYLETVPGCYAPLDQNLAAVQPGLTALVETARDLMGRHQTYVLGHSRQVSIGPWYLSRGEGLYDWIAGILERKLVLHQLRTSLVWVRGEEAVRLEGCLEITDLRQDRAAFRVHLTGKQQLGSFAQGRFREKFPRSGETGWLLPMGQTV